MDDTLKQGLAHRGEGGLGGGRHAGLSEGTTA